MSGGNEGGFLSRWAERKALQRQGRELPAEPAPLPAPLPAIVPAAAPLPVRPELVEAPTAGADVATSSARTDVTAPVPPLPTLEDARALTPASDFRRFVAPEVDPEVRNQALKTLFTDPQFNVMDGLDTYIDDYGKPDPLPMSMLRQMASAHALGLFDDERDKEDKAAAAMQRADPDGALAPSAATSMPATMKGEPPNDDDVAVRLQPDDAARPPGPGDGAGEGAGRER